MKCIQTHKNIETHKITTPYKSVQVEGPGREPKCQNLYKTKHLYLPEHDIPYKFRTSPYKSGYIKIAHTNT